MSSRPRLRTRWREQVVLGRGQVDLLAVAADPARGEVDLEPVDARSPARLLARARSAAARRAGGRPARRARTAWSRSRRRRPPARAPSRAPRRPRRARRIGIRLHSRIERRRPRPRRRRAAPDRRSPRRAGGPRPRRAPRARSSPGRPRSRRRRGSPAARAGSAARRRRSARAGARSSAPRRRGRDRVGGIGRQSDREGRPLPGQRLRPERAAVGLDEAPGDRQAQAGAAARSSPAWKGSKIRSSSARGIPGPRSATRIATLARRSAERRSVTGSLAGEADRVLDHVRERPLELRRVGPNIGSSGSIETSKPLRRRRGRSIAASISSSAEDQSARGSSCPGLQPREVEQVVDQRGRAARSRPRSPRPARRAASSSSVVELSPPAAAVIAVSGERRSCETERSSAVLTTLRAPQGARLDHLRLEAARAGERRVSSVSRLGTRPALEQPRRASGSDVARDGNRARARCPSTTIGSARRRSSLSVHAELDLDPGQVEAPGRSAGRRPAATPRGSRRRAAPAPSRRSGRPRGGGARPPRRGRARRRPASR